MAEQDLQKSALATRDQLGRPDSINPVGVWDFKEQIGIEEGPTAVFTRNIGTAFILGHPDNGVIGTDLLGAGTYGSNVVDTVVNSNNAFHEHFRDSDYNDSTNSTASWDTTNYRWEFIPNDVGQTKSIFLNRQSVTKILPKLIVEGISITTQIDQVNFSGGREVNIT